MSEQFHIEYRQQDSDIYNERIKPFLPGKIFDTHAHLLLDEYHPNLFELNPITKIEGLHDIDAEKLKAWWKELFPGVDVSGMIMGFPTKCCDLKNINKSVSKQAKQNGYPFVMMVHPQDSPVDMERSAKETNAVALKPYMVFVEKTNFKDCAITDMIGEEQLEIADEYGLAVILHVSRPQGMADKRNLAELRYLSRKYQNCQFILAHCGRCFIGINAKKMIRDLTQADNIWIDTSAVCDSAVFIHLLRDFRLDRILFGSDLVTAAGFRGSYIKFADQWKNYLDDACTFELYENLCSLLEGAEICQLGKYDLCNIFYNNAAKLFNLED